MPQNEYELRWRAEVISKLASSNKIDGRSNFAKALGLGRSTIYESFDEQWRGTATSRVLAHVAGRFNVPISRLVIDPRVKE